MTKTTTALAIILTVLMVVAGFLYYRQYLKPPTPTPEVGGEKQVKTATPTMLPSPTASPTPKPLKPGNETYTVSQPANQPGPKIREITLKPHDLKVNQSQTIEVTFVNPTTVTSAQATFVSDNKSLNLPLTLKNNLWTTTHTVTDTVLYRYLVTITATDSTGTSKVDLTLR